LNELNVAICDSEASYSERFASYLVEHKGKNVRVHIYTDKELFTKDMERERFDIAVIGGKYSDAGREVGGRGIPVLI
jgi:hypothetical protein